MHDVLEDMRIDLELRGFLDNTVKTYLRYAGKFVDEIGIPLARSPATTSGTTCTSCGAAESHRKHATCI